MRRIAFLFSFALAVLSFPQTASCSPSVATSTVGPEDRTNQLTTEMSAPSLQNRTCEVDQPNYQVPSQLESLAITPVEVTNSVTVNPSSRYVVRIQDDHPASQRGPIALPDKQNGSAQQITAFQQLSALPQTTALQQITAFKQRIALQSYTVSEPPVSLRYHPTVFIVPKSVRIPDRRRQLC